MSELSVESLRSVAEPSEICVSTKELTPVEGIIGQKRATKALKFGLEIKQQGFNIYVSGLQGTGRKTAVMGFLEKLAAKRLVPSDWCYVNNFQNPYEPKAIRLPAGRGKEFQGDVKSFIEETRRLLPKAFESDDYASKRDSVVGAIEDERKALLTKLNERALKEGFVLKSTPIGVLIVPMIRGQPLNDQQLLSLPKETRDEIEKKREKLESELRSAMRQLAGLQKKVTEEIQKLNQEVATYVIGHRIDALIDEYKEFNEVKEYLQDMEKHIIENLVQFIQEPKATQAPFSTPWMEELPFRKYEINVIVDNSNLEGAPVILELNPIHQHLFGRIEKEAQFGVLTTDFTMIRGGSLHQANGGYLILPAEDLLRNLFSYDTLKRALANKFIDIEEAGERLGFITTKGLKPQPIPLDLKVILIGHPYLYQQLYLLDMDFKELFKVKADFDTSIDRTEENMQKYASFVCTFCRKEKLKHLNGSGMAKVIEYGSRLSQDQQKLSTQFGEIADIIREANFYANQDNSEYITSAHIRKVIDEKIYRSNLIQEKIREMIERGTILIDTEGEVVGQVNGLSVMSLGDFAFGAPSRVTVSIGVGREGIIDIQREAKMAGPIHTKGVMILSGYLASKYSKDKPLSLSARLVFEQSYGMVEGDSASSTELYAIISALSDIPIKQEYAVTGSVNQKGEIQAIGGVNEKIEGFFEVCKAKGLTGKQGVLIPESNVKNLMLKEEVIEAVRNSKFHIHAVKTIDEGIELLTEVKAGLKLSDGNFEKDSVNFKVDQSLMNIAEKLKEFPEFIIEKK
jgi:lon-related putative ATP-dependent protease